jgi:hypothetical protein
MARATSASWCPFAKAYSGLTDAEIRQVDNTIRKTTVEKFGPVRSVKPTMVFELGFEGIALSPRHKAGIAVRFPRILRRRDDKPVEQADTLDTLKGLAGSGPAMSKSQAEAAVDAWFAARGWKVFPFQRAVWKARWPGNPGCCTRTPAPARPTPCGSRRCCAERIAPARRTGLRVLWITPMRALAADTQRSLEVSAAELGAASPDAIGAWTSARAPATPARPSARASRKACPAR